MPRMPKSPTLTPSGSVRAASDVATSTPKPSSPRKMLPIPATSTRRVTGRLPDRRSRPLRLRGRAVRPRLGRRRGSALAIPAPRLAGSSSMLTATWSSPSTSLNTPVTVAARPAKNRSWASARRDGRRRTREPLPTLTPATERVSVHGSTEASTLGSHHGRGSPSGSVALGCTARTAPCSRAHISSGMLSQRSMMAAARGSVARASAFSSSVRVSTRRARISSISVAS